MPKMSDRNFRVPSVGPQNKIERQIADFLVSQFPDVAAVYLYGSRANGMVLEDSDWDLALLFAPRRSPEADTIFEVQVELGAELRAEVDVVVLSLEQLVLAKEVWEKGRILLDKQPLVRQTYEMNLLSAYAEYREDLRPVIAAYSFSESVHG